MSSASTKRVSNTERIGRVFAAKDNEIQRLRAAMVHAMDECEHEASCSGSSITRSNMRRVAANLKAALEKK